jgi:hypothetical protein
LIPCFRDKILRDSEKGNGMLRTRSVVSFLNCFLQATVTDELDLAVTRAPPPSSTFSAHEKRKPHWITSNGWQRCTTVDGCGRTCERERGEWRRAVNREIYCDERIRLNGEVTLG